MKLGIAILAVAMLGSAHASTDDLLEEYGCTIDTTTTILCRHFSGSIPSADGSTKPGYVIDPQSPLFGGINVFIRNVLKETSKLGSHQCVLFDNGENGVTACRGTAVGDGPDNCGGNGASLDLYNLADSKNKYSTLLTYGGAFSPPFGAHLVWLYDMGAIDEAQEIIDKRGENTIALPCSALARESSGVFRYDMADFKNIADICALNEKWRILGDNTNIIERACLDNLDGYDPDCDEGNDLCISAGASGVSVLDNVRSGGFTGFEFGCAMDNWESLFNFDDNPGDRGLRFYHYPAWHQPFEIVTMYINQSEVWDTLTEGQREAIKKAAKKSVKETFELVNSVECLNLGKILNSNSPDEVAETPADVLLPYLKCDDKGKFTGEFTNEVGEACNAEMHLTSWRKDVLNALEAAANDRLLTDYDDDIHYSLCQGDGDCLDIRDSMLAYRDSINFFKWKPEVFPKNCGNLKKKGGNTK